MGDLFYKVDKALDTVIPHLQILFHFGSKTLLNLHLGILSVIIKVNISKGINKTEQKPRSTDKLGVFDFHSWLELQVLQLQIIINVSFTKLFI